MKHLINPVSKEIILINSQKGKNLLKNYIKLNLIGSSKKNNIKNLMSDKKKKKIKNMLEHKGVYKIKIYGLSNCEYCKYADRDAKKIVELLKASYARVEYKYYDLNKVKDPKPGYKSVPKVFIKKFGRNKYKFVGGYSELMKYYKLG